MFGFFKIWLHASAISLSSFVWGFLKIGAVFGLENSGSGRFFLSILPLGVNGNSSIQTKKSGINTSGKTSDKCALTALVFLLLSKFFTYKIIFNCTNHIFHIICNFIIWTLNFEYVLNDKKKITVHLSWIERK